MQEEAEVNDEPDDGTAAARGAQNPDSDSIPTRTSVRPSRTPAQSDESDPGSAHAGEESGATMAGEEEDEDEDAAAGASQSEAMGDARQAAATLLSDFLGMENGVFEAAIDAARELLGASSVLTFMLLRRGRRFSLRCICVFVCVSLPLYLSPSLSL